jgi:serine/threonine protein kinase
MDSDLSFWKSQNLLLSCSQTLSVLEDIFNGLKEIHSFGIVHNDIKEENILMYVDKKHTPRFKISDLGISKFEIATGTPIKFTGTSNVAHSTMLLGGRGTIPTDLILFWKVLKGFSHEEQLKFVPLIDDLTRPFNKPEEPKLRDETGENKQEPTLKKSASHLFETKFREILKDRENKSNK